MYTLTSFTLVLSTVEPIPFDLEHLLPGLMGVASKWKSLGEALSLDDDIVDEIFTNNETEEECLREMLERYLMRSDLKHNWEEIEDEEALASIEKDSSGGSGTECCDDLQETSALHSKPASGGFLLIMHVQEWLISIVCKYM